MPERGSTFGLTLCGLRPCVLRSFVWVVVAAGVASTGAAPPVEACTFKPNGRAPHGRHWYYMVDHAKRHCWYLGPVGLAVQRSATRRSRHRAAVAHERSAAKKTVAARPATAPATTAESGATLGTTVVSGATLTATAEPSATLATIAESGATPAAADGAEAHAPALPAPEAAGVSEQLLAAEPAEPGPAGEIQSPDAIAPEATMLAPGGKAAEAPQPAATAPPELAAASEHDHTFASIVIAAALLVIAGLVLWAIGWWRGRKTRAATPSAPPARPSWVGASTPLVLERTAVRHRQPPGARDQASEEIGPPRLLDGAPRQALRGRATRRSP